MAPRDGQFVRSQIFRIYEYVTEVQEATSTGSEISKS